MLSKKLLRLLLFTNLLLVQSYINIPCLTLRKLHKHSLPSLMMSNENSKPQSVNRRNILFLYLGTNLLGINTIFLYDNMLPNIEKAQANIFYNAVPSVCYISTEYNNMADKYNLNKEDLPKGVGTGFIWDKKGHIITNFHVINKVDNAVITITDKNNNKKNYNAKLTGIDPDLDIAVLKIDTEATDNLQVINYNKNIKTTIGENAYAIGNPFGQDHTFTAGIISENN